MVFGIYSYRFLGAHFNEKNGLKGVEFSLWAPHAKSVSVVGDFNFWNGEKHQMQLDAGIWKIFIPGLQEGALYKYEITTQEGKVFLKSDPYAFYSEVRPQTASRLFRLEGYNWHDAHWQEKKKTISCYESPLNIYEVHLGSWRRDENKGSAEGFLNYRVLAEQLVNYLAEMGYTHLEILPLTEHPYDGSWGYQTTGYYAVTSRYGNPHDFMYLVDQCHRNGIGVILDWVPGHFCKDQHGLWQFDGSSLFEYEDEWKGDNREWGTANFDLGKAEVKNFLISNAVFWLDVFHLDGLRVDAVSNILYLDYGKKAGEWLPNKHGGNENLEGVDFLKELSTIIAEKYPGTLLIAEESSQWPAVTGPVYKGGLGFTYKWNMGWMNDTLRYMEMDPIYRKYAHNLLTFSQLYAYSEKFILTLSHDEVVHCKKSLLNKMPGDYWQKFANLRLLYGYLMTHPGKKLLFMGGELGQFDEWNENEEIHWNLLSYEAHQRLHSYVKDLNKFYKLHKPLWELDHDSKGFSWIDPHDCSQSVITFLRRGKDERDYLIIVCNFTPVVREPYRIGVPELKYYKEIFNSDLDKYGGSGQSNYDALKADELSWHNQEYSLEIKLPPLAVIILTPLNEKGERQCQQENV